MLEKEKKICQNKLKLHGLNSLQESVKAQGNKVDISSYARTQLLVVSILLVTAIIQFLEFGGNFENENAEGCFLFLGGPSLFYPTSLLTILFIIPIIFYIITSIKKITMCETEHFYAIREKRVLVDFITEIPKERIIGIFLTNTKTGTRFLWIIPFGIHMWYLGQDGLFYISNQFAFFRGYRTGFYYIFQAIIDVIVLSIIIFKQRTHLEIHTDQKQYEMRFSTPFSRRKTELIYQKICILFKMSQENKKCREKTFNNMYSEILNHPRLISGVIFTIIAILSRLFQVFASEPLRFVLFIGGIILIVKGIKEELPISLIDNFNILDNSIENIFEYKKFGFLYNISNFSDPTNRKIKNSNTLQPTDLFDNLILILAPLFITMTISTDLLLIPITLNSGFFIIISIQIIGSFIILSLIVWIYLKPQKILIVEHLFRKYNIHLKQSKRDGMKLSKYGKMQLIIRLSILLFSGILGILTFSEVLLN
ncbi:MAG: hypothetical protein GY870_13520 [archaeon]|nr:hypothetical protein [archaeon]